MTGQISIDGEPIRFTGTGLQVHSWGPRDYSLLGDTFWAQGQFLESGRSFMVIRVSGKPPRPDFTFALVSHRHETTTPRPALELPLPSSDADLEEHVEFALALPDGSTARISAELIAPVPMTTVGSVEIAFGRPAEAFRLEREVFARFTWDGEIGYGLVDRTLEMTGTA